MKLIKFINNAGYCSRRKAQELIENKEIYVNDKCVTDLSYLLNDFDRVFHEDYQIKMNIVGANIYLYYKPVGVVCSHSDPNHKNTVFSNVNIKTKDHLVTVGRLDINSEGLILITNSKRLAHNMERSNLSRIYKVRVYGDITKLIENNTNMITFQGYQYSNFDIYIPNKKQESSNHWVYVTLRSGQNNEVRNIMTFFGLQVNRLIRIQYGPFKLNNLKANEVLYLKYSKNMLDHFIDQIKQ